MRTILIALGANVAGRAGAPAATLDAAVAALERGGLTLLRRSPWYVSAAVPPSAQPRYINGVIEVRTPLPPEKLLRVLHTIEKRFGRARRHRNAPRPLDLDLLDWKGQVLGGEAGTALVLPHPRMTSRAFVLVPLRDIAPRWRHPVSGLGAAALLKRLPPAGRPYPLIHGRLA